MQSWDDVFDYKKLPGWGQENPTIRTIDVVPGTPSVRPSWLPYAIGISACCGVVFATQLMLAFASGDLRGYRARAIDTSSAASVLLAVGAGVVVGREVKQ